MVLGLERRVWHLNSCASSWASQPAEMQRLLARRVGRILLHKPHHNLPSPISMVTIDRTSPPFRSDKPAPRNHTIVSPANFVAVPARRLLTTRTLSVFRA